MAYGKWQVKSRHVAWDMQEGINLHLNVFGAQLFAESMEKQPPEVQAEGVTLCVRDHNGTLWYVTATTAEPQIVTEGDEVAK
jgi:hypothetical protein